MLFKRDSCCQKRKKEAIRLLIRSFRSCIDRKWGRLSLYVLQAPSVRTLALIVRVKFLNSLIRPLPLDVGGCWEGSCPESADVRSTFREAIREGRSRT
jgi:hypothetical protein